MTKGVRLQGPHGPIMLKWHRLRLVAGDVDFTAARLRQGLAAGASMEIDLRRHAERGFVCLHDGVLESETNGRGAVAAASVPDLRRLRMRGPDGAITGEPLLLLDDLVEIARDSHPDAVVQFDLKEHLADLDEATISSFARLVAPSAQRFLLSGDDWNAVRAIGERVDGPEARISIRPTCPRREASKSAKDFSDFTRFTLAAAPNASIIYLDYRLVLASLVQRLRHDRRPALRRQDGRRLDVRRHLPGFLRQPRPADRKRRRSNLDQRFHRLAGGGGARASTNAEMRR